MQVFQVNFGGGEPFLRDDFLDILRYAHRLGITTCVSTNGTVLDDGPRRRAPAHGRRPVYLQVSLDGAVRRDQRRHPRRRDVRPHPGRHRAAGASAAIPTSASTWWSPALNAGEVGDFDGLARGYGAKTRLSRFRPSGAGCGRWEDYRLTREQLARAVGVPRRPPGDPHRRFVLRPHAGQPARAGAEHVRRGQDDLRRRARRQRLPLRLPVRPGVPRRQRHRGAALRHLRDRRRCSSGSASSRWRAAAGATASASATAAVPRSDTS